MREVIRHLVAGASTVLIYPALCFAQFGTVAGVVKADGYGLGSVPITRALAAAGCDTFFVARLEEGVRLRPVVPQARIFVLDGATPDSVPALITHRLTPVLNSLTQIAGWSAARALTSTQIRSWTYARPPGCARKSCAASSLAPSFTQIFSPTHHAPQSSVLAPQEK